MELLINTLFISRVLEISGSSVLGVKLHLSGAKT